MKLKGFYRDKSPKPFEIDGAIFYLKPLNQSQMVLFTSKATAQSPDIFSVDVKRSFARDHVTGWDGLLYDNDDPVEYTVDNSIELLTDENYDDLFAALFNKSYSLANELEKGKKEDLKQGKQ